MNRVKLFYMLVATIGSESRRCLWGRGGHMHAVCMQRWLAMARPPPRVAGHGLATCKGQSIATRPPARGSHLRARPAVASPQGPTSNGQPTRGYRPRPALPPAGAAASVVGVATPWQGSYRSPRAVAACVGAALAMMQ
ncbi:hypothetical protein B296_00057021 [Ensete ventricosum]|uniref:Uncharacterized protein n=1 Tax=Ensete ventricosum TaxID=4639 RepID=A0A426WVJ1_ENSVE|nr:hypothetical protein B296_00057021 [Ensete ventricosum]